MILSDFCNIYKKLSRDGAEVMRVCLRYPSFGETPAVKKLNRFFENIAQAYLRYAEGLVPTAKRGSSVSMESEVWKEDGYISVYYDITEYEGTDQRPKLVNYRRMAYVWDSAGGFIIPAHKLLKKCSNERKLRVKRTKTEMPKEKTQIDEMSKAETLKYDGCYIMGHKLYIYINHYKKGIEEGKRRSEYRRFIEVIYVGLLSDC
ncbi:MAG: hypothetical protein ACYCWE_12180 [Eubacteriales bacterium]